MEGTDGVIVFEVGGLGGLGGKKLLIEIRVSKE